MYSINQRWISEIQSLKNTEFPNCINSLFLINFEKILKLNDSFINEQKYLSQTTINEFNNIYIKYNNYFNQNISNITIQNIQKSKKFDNNFVFLFTCKGCSEVLDNLPVKINNSNFFTDSQAQITYKADYSQPVIIKIGHQLKDYIDSSLITIYYNNSFSPFHNENIILKIVNTNKTLLNEFAKILEQKRFKIGENPDIIIDISEDIKYKQVSLNKYICSLSIQLTIKDRQQKILKKINIPQNSNDRILGYGNSEAESLISASKMEYFNEKKAFTDLLENFIKELLQVN